MHITCVRMQEVQCPCCRTPWGAFTWKEPLKLNSPSSGSGKSTLGTTHPRSHCAACSASPITGPRYTCCTCSNLSLCLDCFQKGVHPQHNFMCYQRPNAPAEQAKRKLLHPDCHAVLPALDCRRLCTLRSAVPTTRVSKAAAPAPDGLNQLGLITARCRQHGAQQLTFSGDGASRHPHTSPVGDHIANHQHCQDSTVGEMQTYMDPEESGQNVLQGTYGKTVHDVHASGGFSIQGDCGESHVARTRSQQGSTWKGKRFPDTKVSCLLSIHDHPRKVADGSAAKPGQVLVCLKKSHCLHTTSSLDTTIPGASDDMAQCAISSQSLAHHPGATRATSVVGWGRTLSKDSSLCGTKLSRLRHCRQRHSVPGGGENCLGKFEVLCGTSIPLTCGCEGPVQVTHGEPCNSLERSQNLASPVYSQEPVSEGVQALPCSERSFGMTSKHGHNARCLGRAWQNRCEWHLPSTLTKHKLRLHHESAHKDSSTFFCRPETKLTSLEICGGHISCQADDSRAITLSTPVQKSITSHKSNSFFYQCGQLTTDDQMQCGH
jgi:hypothetical protein